MRAQSMSERLSTRRVETFRRETMDWTATPMREQLGMMRRIAFLEWKPL